MLKGRQRAASPTSPGSVSCWHSVRLLCPLRASRRAGVPTALRSAPLAASPARQCNSPTEGDRITCGSRQQRGGATAPELRRHWSGKFFEWKSPERPTSLSEDKRYGRSPCPPAGRTLYPGVFPCYWPKPQKDMVSFLFHWLCPQLLWLETLPKHSAGVSNICGWLDWLATGWSWSNVTLDQSSSVCPARVGGCLIRQHRWSKQQTVTICSTWITT